MIYIFKEVLFWFFVISTIWTDVQWGKILNAVTFPVAFTGILLNTISVGTEGFLSSLVGLLVGLALLGWVYYLGGAGGGDVKFLGAMGALMGYEFLIIGALWGFIIAGIAAMFFIILKKQFIKTWGNIFEIVKNFFIASGAGASFKSNSNLPQMPYGVYLSLGFALYRIYFYITGG